MLHLLRGRLTAIIVPLLLIGVFALGCSGKTTSGQTAPTEAPTTQQSASTETPTTQPSSATESTQPPTTVQASTKPVTGSPKGGDPYFPWAGNGGYDVQSYEISLDIDPASGRIVGDTTVTATPLQDLAAFYLDLVGLDVVAVAVDGSEAEFKRYGQDLKITCPKTLSTGNEFSVKISYSGVPTGMKPLRGWQKSGDTIFTSDEPQGAATWFPVNDMPADKATYTFRLTVPKPYTATASGVLVTTEPRGSGQTFVWKMEQPMANYVAAVNVGQFTLETSKSPEGVTIRDYFAPDLAAKAHAGFARTGEVIDYFASLFGPYPFPAYGVVAPDADTTGAMENQTLALFGQNFINVTMTDPKWGPIFLSHELAHQWFGDSVTIKQWDDIWLNEGFAGYASWLWLEHDQGPQALQAMVDDGLKTMSASKEPPPGHPGRADMFGDSVYQRGALTLHALRLTVGDESFFSTLHTWCDRYRYGNADTADFIALAKEEAPQVPSAQIDALFDAWLYQPQLPALPQRSTASLIAPRNRWAAAEPRREMVT